jgi:hypothetical protein
MRRLSQINDSVRSDKIKALALAKECYTMKLELLTKATVVNNAIMFVALHVVRALKTANFNASHWR